jgi:hypothetical protein
MRNAIGLSPAAFGRDVEFFNFYRSMQAYTKSLAGTETTLVLSPDSEFFRHFGMGGSSSEPQQVELEQESPAPQAEARLGEVRSSSEGAWRPGVSGEPQAAQVAPQAAPEEGAPQQQ